MKPAHVALLLLALFARPLAAQTKELPAAAETKKPEIGPSHVVLADNGISLDLPQGIDSRPDIARGVEAKFTKKSTSGHLCTRMPLLAFDSSALRRIYVWQYNGECLEQPVTEGQLRATVLRLMHSMLHTQGAETVTSPIDYTLAGHPADVITGSVYAKENHGLLFSEATCLRVKLDVVCLAFTSSSVSKARRLAALPLRFDSSAATAAIPEDVSKLALFPTNTFHDDRLHVEFEYPGTFGSAQPRAEAALAEKLEKASNGEKRALGCTKVKLTADDFEDDSHANISIFDFDLACNHIKIGKNTARDILKGFASGFGKGAKYKPSKPASYSLGTHEMFYSGGEMKAKDKSVLEVLHICTLLGTDAYCWQITSTSAENLRALAGSNVTFDRGLGTPLVPANLLAGASR